MDRETFNYIKRVSQLADPSQTYTGSRNPRVRTSPYVTELRIDRTDHTWQSSSSNGHVWIYLDLSNGNVLVDPYRMGESEAITNIIYLYNTVGINTDIDTVKCMFEEWTTVHGMTFFKFFEDNFIGYSNTSVIGKFINEVDHYGDRTVLGKVFDSVYIRNPKWDISMVVDSYVSTSVSKKIYNLLRMTGKDYLFIYLKNSPSIIDKFKQSTGLDKLTNQGILDLGIKEFCCNVGLESFVNKRPSKNAVTVKTQEVNRINEALIDLGAIAQRFL